MESIRLIIQYLFRRLSALIVMVFAGVLAALIAIGYLIRAIFYLTPLMGGALYQYPMLLFFPIGLWGLIRYIRNNFLGREFEVERNRAAVIRSRHGRLESRFRGRHRLQIGDRVCGWIPLEPESLVTNEEEVQLSTDDRVRLFAACQLVVSDPVRLYQAGGKDHDHFIALNRWALAATMEEFTADDLFNAPFEADRSVAGLLNQALDACGLQVSHYQLQEALWPQTYDHWRRVNAGPYDRSREFWSETHVSDRRLN